MEKDSFLQEYFVYFKKKYRISSIKDRLKPIDAFVRCCPKNYRLRTAPLSAEVTILA